MTSNDTMYTMLFHYAMTVIPRLERPEGVKILACADDLVIYCTNRRNVLRRLQSALNMLSSTASTSGFLFSHCNTARYHKHVFYINFLDEPKTSVFKSN